MPLSGLKPLLPRVVFDKDISEDDGLWDATGGNETHEGFVERIKGAFDDVWNRSKGYQCELWLNEMINSEIELS